MEAHGWAPQATAMATVTSIMRLQQIFLARSDAELRPLGLTFARYEVMMLLSFSSTGSLPLGKIGERLQVNAASVTNAVDRLEADGLVARRPNPGDGRGTLAAITAEGRTVAARATVAMRWRIWRPVRPASIKSRTSAVSRYAPLPSEPLPKIVN